jgi:putative hemolysin
LVAARPLAAMSTLTRPAVWLLAGSTDVAVRLMGGDPSRQREAVTEEELREMVAAQPTFTDKQRLIIDGAFEISERTLQQVLRPRRDVFVLDADTPTRDALEQLAASGHSRAPVGGGGSLDEVVGVVHLRDLLADGDRLVREFAVELCAFPETVGVLDALHEMQARRVQMAVVVDEHGSTAGIITVEDLVEELVGEIYDETDRDVLAVRRAEDGSIVLPGRFPIHDLGDVGIHEIPDGAYATVAGLVLDHLGHLPDTPGDRVSVGIWQFEVTGVDGHAITEVRVRSTVTAKER